jgi:hypothetical protein
MNESELKDLFVSSLESGHIFDNKNRNPSYYNLVTHDVLGIPVVDGEKYSI